MKTIEICAISFLLMDNKKNIICHALSESTKEETLKTYKYRLKHGLYYWYQLNEAMDGRQETIKTDSYIIVL